jgi:hypothetical protein
MGPIANHGSPPPDILHRCPPALRRSLASDFGAVQADLRQGLSAGNAQAQSTTWRIWSRFCAELRQDPYLSGCPDPIPLLQLFAR